MKKVYLMKGMAAMALGLVVASCNKMDAFNPYAEQEMKQQQFTENFQSSVMNGQSIDQNQTWATSTPVQVSVKSDKSGTLKIYTANPLGEMAAALITQNITAGTINVTVAKPADAENLYAALIDPSDYSLNVMKVTDNAVAFTAAKSVASAPRRAPAAPTAEGWDFADAPTDAAFATAIPGDALAADVYYANYSTRKGYYLADTEETQTLNFWMGNADIYLSGTKTLKFTNPGDNTPAVTFYVLPGANVTFTSDFNYQKANGIAMYIAADATVTFEGDMTSNVYAYNRGTIIVKGATGPYGDGLIYNENVITSQKNLTVSNAGSQIVNAGTWTVAEGLTVEGSGHVQNLGTMTITGTTLVNSNSCSWVNDGTWTTDNYTYNAGSTDVINNCKLIVNELFTINLGDTDKNCFAINANGGVTTKNLHFAGPGYIKMAGNSLFKVTNTATMDAKKVDYGFWGPTSGDSYAVLQAKTITTSDPEQAYDITYGGNIYVACDSHFANGKSGQYPIIDIIGNAKIYNGQLTAPYTINADGSNKCNDGYKGGNTPDPDPVQWYYYAFEDLGTTDDFDFNDVIIRVSAPVDNVSTVQLVAAGGTLATTVLYNEQVFNATEVHELFGTTPSNSGMVNTGNGPEKKFVTLGTVTLTANDDPADLPFGISAQGTNGQLTKVTHSVENIGKAPLVIVVAGYPSGDNAGRWFWPTERTMISDAYTDFGAWGANASSYQNWYTNYDSNKVYQWNSSKEE